MTCQSRGHGIIQSTWVNGDLWLEANVPPDDGEDVIQNGKGMSWTREEIFAPQPGKLSLTEGTSPKMAEGTESGHASLIPW